MNAREARELANSKLKGTAIKPMMDYFHKRVEEAASEGKTNLISPFDERVPIDWHNPNVQKAVWLAIQNEGCEVVHHPDPGPGHPGSRPYTSVSW